MLSSGRTTDQWHLAGCSHDAAYKAVDAFTDAVNPAPELEIHMPQSTEHWEMINA